MNVSKTTYKNIYKNLIESKYKFTTKELDKRFTEEPLSIFLFYFDMFNVYPLFPTVIDLPYVDTVSLTPKNQDNLFDLTQDLNGKINMWTSIPKKELRERAKPMIRKLFSYELIDDIKDNFNAEYVTVAWLKCYELVHNYKLTDNLDLSESTVNYFGICEQPGAFVFALNHYIKTKTMYKFDFIIESLIDKTNKKIFKPNEGLFNKYKDKYDYGYDGTGDVTNLENIKYYRKKYYDKKFHIITADCGLDCSNDFTLQEKGLMKVFLGQLLLAISLADKGTNYFYKYFTLYEDQSKDMLFLANKLFDKVSICRTLTTKPQSGEIYIVCKGFNKTKKEMDNILPLLYNMFNNNNFVEKRTHVFDNYVYEVNVLLTMRRITSINFLYFRFKNSHYAKDNPKIHKYINNMVEHYKNYFLELNQIEKIDDAQKLI